MMTDFSSRCRRRGFSLIEAVIVLAVIGLVLGGIWVAASAVSARTRENQMYGDLLAITDYIHTTYRTTDLPPGGVDWTEQIGISVPLAGFERAGSTLKGPWGTVGAFSLNMTGSRYIQLYFVAPRASCIKLIQRLNTARLSKQLVTRITGDGQRTSAQIDQGTTIAEAAALCGNIPNSNITVWFENL